MSSMPSTWSSAQSLLTLLLPLLLLLLMLILLLLLLLLPLLLLLLMLLLLLLLPALLFLPMALTLVWESAVSGRGFLSRRSSGPLTPLCCCSPACESAAAKSRRARCMVVL